MKPLAHFIAVSLSCLALGSAACGPAKSPFEEHWQDAVELGREFSFCLFHGRKAQLLRLAASPASEKLGLLSLREISFQEADRRLEGKSLTLEMRGPVTTDEMKDYELVAFEKLGSFVVTTFAHSNGLGEITQLPGKGRLLFSVAMRHRVLDEPGLLGKGQRRISEAPAIGAVAPHLGTRGAWEVIDFKYRATAEDYLKWVESKGEKKLDQDLSKMDDPDEWDAIERSADASLQFLYAWAERKTKQQPLLIDKTLTAESKVAGPN